MARLQVLYLPSRPAQANGDGFTFPNDDGRIEPRFALVVDELDGPLTDDERADLDAFAAQVDAAGVFATTRTVDCDQGDGTEVEEFAARLRELVDERIGETVQASLAQQKPATEAKPTRTWGTVERDPRENIPGWTPEQAQEVFRG